MWPADMMRPPRPPPPSCLRLHLVICCSDVMCSCPYAENLNKGIWGLHCGNAMIGGKYQLRKMLQKIGSICAVCVEQTNARTRTRLRTHTQTHTQPVTFGDCLFWLTWGSEPHLWRWLCFGSWLVTRRERRQEGSPGLKLALFSPAVCPFVIGQNTRRPVAICQFE